MRLAILAPLALAVLLGGCATLSEEECIAGNWQEIGQRDGQNGRTADFIAQHAKACEKAGVVPDRAQWERGRQAGLTAYCTPQKVYQEGRSGRSLSPVCPAASLPALQAAHAKGAEYHRIGLDISSLESEARSLERALVAEKDASRRLTLMLDVQRARNEIMLLRLRQQRVATL